MKQRKYIIKLQNGYNKMFNKIEGKIRNLPHMQKIFEIKFLITNRLPR